MTATYIHHPSLLSLYSTTLPNTSVSTAILMSRTSAACVKASSSLKAGELKSDLASVVRIGLSRLLRRRPAGRRRDPFERGAVERPFDGRSFVTGYVPELELLAEGFGPSSISVGGDPALRRRRSSRESSLQPFPFTTNLPLSDRCLPRDCNFWALWSAVSGEDKPREHSSTIGAATLTPASILSSRSRSCSLHQLDMTSMLMDSTRPRLTRATVCSCRSWSGVRGDDGSPRKVNGMAEAMTDRIALMIRPNRDSGRDWSGSGHCRRL